MLLDFCTLLKIELSLLFLEALLGLQVFDGHFTLKSSLICDSHLLVLELSLSGLLKILQKRLLLCRSSCSLSGSLHLSSFERLSCSNFIKLCLSIICTLLQLS